jgi:hypothetical protein
MYDEGMKEEGWIKNQSTFDCFGIVTRQPWVRRFLANGLKLRGGHLADGDE